MELTLNSYSDFQPLLDFEEETLGTVPYNDLSELTREIKLSFVDYVRQGVMLAVIRRNRLYKRQFKDFAEYCKLALGRSPIYCKRIIEAAQTTIELIKVGFKILPTSVSQSLPLVRFTKIDAAGNRELEDKWQTVLDGFPPESITAAKIKEVLDETPEGRAKQVRVSGKAYEVLVKKAAEAGMTTREYLEMLIGGTEPPDDEPDDVEPTELTPEKEEICDRAEASFARAPITSFNSKNLSTYLRKAINLPIRSDKASDSS